MSRMTKLNRAAWFTRTHTFTSLQRRFYAQAADVPPPNNKSGSQSQRNQQQWQRKQPLATAQTLTLFSETPQGLLIALRSTLQSMTSLASRLGPALNTTIASKKGHHDHVLLYALSKDLPSQYLSEAVSILRGPDPVQNGTTKKNDTQGMTAAQIAKMEAEAAANQHTDNPQSRIARVGILSSPLPSSLIPSNAIEPGSPPIATPTLYSAALSLLPGVNAIPFRSTIPGRAEVAVGRWTDRKPSWQQGAERRADLLDDGNGALPGGSRDWREIWGRENLEGKVPEGLESLNPSSAASFILFSDTSPHGLIEGLATQFPASSVLGLSAPPTPFETGRDQTMLISLPQGTAADVQPSSSIHDTGAVGVALVASNNANDADYLPIPSIRTEFEGLQPFGPRREITAAQGNIISSLDGSNAAQQFLRDIQTREHPLNLDSSSAKITGSDIKQEAEAMSEVQARQIASKVKKEEDFFIAIYSEPASYPSNSSSSSSSSSRGEGEVQPEPLLLAPILSGHPNRGTLSIDTQVELGPGPGRPQGTMKTYAQFYQIDASFVSRHKADGEHVKADLKLVSPSAIEIPGPDPSVWVTPRFLFLSLPASNDELPKVDQVNLAAEGDKKDAGKKHQVMALPNLFIAASERGWIAGKGRKSSLMSNDDQHNHPYQKGEQGKVGVEMGLQRDAGSIVTCTVPLAKATLSLRADSSHKT
ncbi:uncharacterized protein MEPE_04250 [Melanopsichium pennsylvanicum]|uniref:FIST domain-containing protein n=2 Tax=Melanopsichium pennsylvanicum TaxID=63383 RepID=A0AAJ4XPH9_9BASI|nr:conserved hypothetical protein [Melanopsichium pennsylvanicum 4]SNX85541.1 uncharacterized protein MEPE_04250 [Melanopsichium pennsylvanicum]